MLAIVVVALVAIFAVGLAVGLASGPVSEGRAAVLRIPVGLFLLLAQLAVFGKSACTIWTAACGGLPSCSSRS